MWRLLWLLALPLGATAAPAVPTPFYAWVTGECDLHRAPCRAKLHDGRTIELAIAPRDIPPLKPLQVSVRLEGFDAASVAVRFTGVDVDMGALDYPLFAQGEGLFSGNASLDICSRRRMTWQALVIVQESDAEVRAPFRFETEFRPSFTVIE